MPKRIYSVAPFKARVDVPADIAAIHLDIRKWEIAEVGHNIFLDILDSQADLNALDQYYIARGGNFFIAKDAQQQVIGFVGLRNDGNEQGTFKRLAVVPQWHRRGVGKALVTTAMDWATQAGFTQLSLHTGLHEHARPLYEQFGFRVVDFRDDYKDWAMEWELQRSPTPSL